MSPTSFKIRYKKRVLFDLRKAHAVLRTQATMDENWSIVNRFIKERINALEKDVIELKSQLTGVSNE